MEPAAKSPATLTPSAAAAALPIPERALLVMTTSSRKYCDVTAGSWSKAAKFASTHSDLTALENEYAESLAKAQQAFNQRYLPVALPLLLRIDRTPFTYFHENRHILAKLAGANLGDQARDHLFKYMYDFQFENSYSVKTMEACCGFFKALQFLTLNQANALDTKILNIILTFFDYDDDYLDLLAKLKKHLSIRLSVENTNRLFEEAVPRLFDHDYLRADLLFKLRDLLTFTLIQTSPQVSDNDRSDLAFLFKLLEYHPHPTFENGTQIRELVEHLSKFRDFVSDEVILETFRSNPNHKGSNLLLGYFDKSPTAAEDPADDMEGLITTSRPLEAML